MPYLVCDPQVGVEKYNIKINDIILTPFLSEADGSARYELLDFEPGTYTFLLQAIGQGGLTSEWSIPFVATKPIPASGLRII